MSDSSHECLKMISTVSAGDVQMGVSEHMLLFVITVISMIKKVGVCRVSELVNKS